MSKEKPDDMSKAFRRLRAAAADELRQHFNPGKTTGESWAKEKALPSQLKRLARRVAQSGKKDDIGTVETYVAHTDEYGSVAECLCWDLLGPGDDEDIDPQEFWEKELGKKGAKLIQNEGFAAGFIVGALWVWEEFKASEGAPEPEPQPE